jgi:hypothetical protein
MRSSGHFLLLGLTGHLCPPVCVGRSYWSPVSVRPVFIPVCPSVSPLCLLCVFALPVYSRLCSLLRKAFSVHCIHQRRDVLKDLALLTLQNTVVRKIQLFLYCDPGRQHNYIVSWIFRLQISTRTELFCGFTDVTHSTHSATKRNTVSSLYAISNTCSSHHHVVQLCIM